MTTAREEEAAAIRDLIERGGADAADDISPGDGQSSNGKRLHQGSSAAAHARARREATLRAEGRLHVIAESHFPRDATDVRFTVCTCGWSDSDSPTDDAMADAFRIHRRDIGAERPGNRSGPVERVAPAHGAGDDGEERDDDAGDAAA